MTATHPQDERRSTAGNALHVSVVICAVFQAIADLEPSEVAKETQLREVSPCTPSEGKIASCDFLSSVAAGSWGER